MPLVKITPKATYTEAELCQLVADVLELLRRKHDMLLVDVARELGVAESAVSRAKKYDPDNRTFVTQKRILEHYAGLKVEAERIYHVGRVK